jgi:hypothetical protein
VAVGVRAPGVRAWHMAASPRRPQELLWTLATWRLTTTPPRTDAHSVIDLTRRVGNRLIDPAERAQCRITDDFSTGTRPGHDRDATCAHGMSAAVDPGPAGTKGVP